MNGIPRIATALALVGILATVAPAATASSVIELDHGQGIIFIQTTGPETRTPVTLGRPGAAQLFALEPLVREPNRTVYRSLQLADGVYDVRIGQNASVHALYRSLTASDLQLVEDQIDALQEDLGRVSSSLAIIAPNLTALEEADRSLHRNVSALSESLGRLQGGIVGVQSSLDSNRVPNGIVMEGDLKDAQKQIQGFVAESSQRFPLWALSLVALNVVTLVAVAFLFVASRRLTRQEEAPAQVPAARVLSPASRAMEDLARRGPDAGIPAHVNRINDAIESTRSPQPASNTGPATAAGEPSGTAASPPGPPTAPLESPLATASSPAASKEPEASTPPSELVPPMEESAVLELGEPGPVTPGEGNYRLMARPVQS